MVEDMLSPGTPAPPFTVTAHDGSTVSLSDFRGHKVLLWFYPKADTPGCTAEGRGFRDHHDEFRERNVVILGASVDTAEDNAAFAERFDFPFLLLCDGDRTLARAYGAVEPGSPYARRISVLIDESGRVARVYDPVSAKTHPVEVLADLG
jgi:peroxiredoxin Q/BCP